MRQTITDQPALAGFFIEPTMKLTPVCKPIYSPIERIAAERERNRRFREEKDYTPQRIANATMAKDKPWVLFTAPAREDGEHHRRYPSKIGERSVFLHEWGPRC